MADLTSRSVDTVPIDPLTGQPLPQSGKVELPSWLYDFLQAPYNDRVAREAAALAPVAPKTIYPAPWGAGTQNTAVVKAKGNYPVVRGTVLDPFGTIIPNKDTARLTSPKGIDFNPGVLGIPTQTAALPRPDPRGKPKTALDAIQTATATVPLPRPRPQTVASGYQPVQAMDMSISEPPDFTAAARARQAAYAAVPSSVVPKQQVAVDVPLPRPRPVVASAGTSQPQQRSFLDAMFAGFQNPAVTFNGKPVTPQQMQQGMGFINQINVPGSFANMTARNQAFITAHPEQAGTGKTILGMPSMFSPMQPQDSANGGSLSSQSTAPTWSTFEEQKRSMAPDSYWEKHPGELASLKQNWGVK